MSIALETAIRSRVAVQDEGLDAEDRGDGEAQAVHARRIHVVHPKTIADWYGFRFTWIVQKIRKLEIVQWGKVIFVLLILAAMLERVKVSGVDSRQHVHSIYAVLALFAEKLYLCAAPRVDALGRMRVF